ncbi:putative ATPase/DNA-binding SARP family transcriptional activator [Thermocatellispora tengchongensis]|uniref:Putative ATPase/DNA-binding SARP family transcriptional activator n=2 Tax=Thermocatellispora tengchongensis TaxID=1073253 RepID=A0A840PGC0_9ACTN|nr:BTAD domain-containing putative transcriptional regulator [Thermocatellispora tengchongensis]MBB5135085.1 putative ATPase/DNA-binding SARP family transcriptional activator [Thermocatellispora tengchongensis]
MRFGVLGTTEALLDDGRRLPVGGPGVRALLAMLLLGAGRVVTAEHLIDGLYGADPPAGATNALQSHVSRLRQVLKAGPVAVEYHAAGYRLAVDPGDVDAHRFERLAERGRAARAAGEHAEAAALLREALALWRGPALADVRDAPFAAAQAVRLEELRLAALEDRAEADLALRGVPGSERHGALVAELRDLVAAHPLRERLRGQLMRALHAEGRRAEALEVFEDARRLLADELGADPSAELAAVHLAILRADGGPVTSPGASPGAEEAGRRRGLPEQLTSFVGRADELERVGKLLAEARLVTLTGPGGAGKSRLAIEAAARARGEVYFAALATLAEGREVPQAVLAALGLRERGIQWPAGEQPPAQDVTERLVAALADREALLVLDNCEHVVDAAARLADRLLGACPGLRVLATSREALGITGESLCPVPPLPLPAPGAGPAEAAGSPAVRLFADRAAAVSPGFRVDAATVADVVRVCRTLDGLPLAIELAAARLRALRLADVADRLDDRFRLLSRGSRTAQPRHQTLRAVVAWSWDLLDPAERVMAGRLTVFPGGATLEAVARVCGLPAYEAEELLTGLVEKSLVEAAEGRYRMLETIRAFCAERLGESGEGEEARLRRAHAAYYLELAETAAPRLHTGEQLTWLARLTAERDNLFAALRWAVAERATEIGLRLVVNLSAYWWLRGMRGEAAPLAAALLDVVGPEPPPDMIEEYAMCVLSAVQIPGHVAEPAPYLRVVERILHSREIPLRHPFLLLFWGTMMGMPEDGSAADLGALRAILAGESPWVRGLMALGTAYQCLLAEAEVAEAERMFVAALASFRESGDRWGVATSLCELAKLADWRGERDRAVAMSDEATVLIEQLGASEDIPEIVCQRGLIHLRAGDLDAAHADYTRAAELARRAALPEARARATVGLVEVARLRGDLGTAARLCEEALAAAPGAWFGAGEGRAMLFVARGRIAAARGEVAEAEACHRQAVAWAVANPSFPAAADAVEGLAGVAVLRGDHHRAALLFGAARAWRGTETVPGPDAARESALAREALGEEVYAAAHAVGAAMTRAEALAFLGL